MASFYARVVLPYRWIVIVSFLLIATLYSVVYLPDFRLGAGEDTLRLEGDDTLDVYTDTRRYFTDDEYALIAIAPPEPWSPEGVAQVTVLTRQLEDLTLDGTPIITRVLSPATAPLLMSRADGTIGIQTLADPEVDTAKAREELTTSEVYVRNVVSDDGETFNMLAYLRPFDEVLAERVPAESDRPAEGSMEYRDRKSAHKRAVIGAIRDVMATHRERGARIQSSGLPAVSVDMVDYIEHDIRTFGWAVTLLLLVALFVFFRRPRFVILPVVTCLITVVTILGLMVQVGVETTVVSSNISSLLFIVGMAHSIHIVVAYREERGKEPDASYHDSISAAVAHIWRPCLYTALTTCVGFLSLMVTDVAPVKHFGVMMACGTICAFVVSLLFLPCALAVLKPTDERPLEDTSRLQVLDACAGAAVRHRALIYAVSLALVVAAGIGISKLRVDTSFVDFFVESTDVHQGIKWVDKIGGTMTLEVILPPEKDKFAYLDAENFDRIVALHDWFDAQPEVGKTMSLASFERYGRRIAVAQSPFLANMPPRTLWAMAEQMLTGGGDDAAQLDTAVEMVLALDTADPGDPADDVWRSRLQARLRETGVDLRRSEFMRRLEARLAEPDQYPPDEVIVTGMFPLFTRMLETVVGSQVRSLGFVFVAVALMLIVLLRHIRAGLIAMIPNMLPIAMVLGTMGFAGITLDIMTITIASVSLGIAADATIHYLIRFRHEVGSNGGDFATACRHAHRSIGRAILYAALTVIAGFLVLVLSKFTPTIYFGALVGVAMVAGILADLVLLPALLISCKTFGEEAVVDGESRE